MTKKPPDGIRESVLGGDRAFRVIDFPGKPKDGGEADAAPCPVTMLGDADGAWHFLDPIGQKRQLAAEKFGNRHCVRGLFRGNEDWLRANFPDRKEFEAEDGSKTTKVVGFQLNAAAAWLQKACSDQGLYGDHLHLRRPGIWRGDDGLPIVHCGNEVLIEGEWRPAGTRTGNQIWIATPPTPRPTMPCDHAVGEHFREEIQRLWRFKLGGASHLLLGLLGTGMLGTAARWRPNGFLCGEGGSGKTMLLEVLRAASPLHQYSNNASEAGVTSVMNGRVTPVFIDESSDRQNQGGAEALMDLVLASASGDGTKAVRGKPDGGHRTVEMAGSILYASVNPPSMQPQHVGRITLFELLKPDGGDDFNADQTALAEWAAANGPALFGRMIAGAERWAACLILFRNALAKADCAAREQDQMGALLSGWWVLCRQGLPDEAGIREAIGMASEFIRPASDAADDSGPRRAVQHLLAYFVQFDGTTRQEQAGMLLQRSWAPTDDSWDHASDFKALGRYGMRPVRPCLERFEWRSSVEGETDFPSGPLMWRPRPDQPGDVLLSCECRSCYRDGRRVPRLSADGGVFLLPAAVKKVFAGGGKLATTWESELGRLGVMSEGNVRVGGLQAKSLWLSREAIDDGADG